MKKALPYILSLLILLVCSAEMSAQKSGRPEITGTVVDENGKPVPYASVAVYSQSDSTLIKGAATGDNGQFLIAMEPGNYYIKVSFLSYEEKFIPSVQHTAAGTDLGQIALNPGALDLDEVVVETEKGQMQMKLDKRVFNVSQDISSRGSNASDILDQLPSVTVDVEGNVSLRGSGNVTILVDGKPSGIVQSGDPQSLRQLMGNQIERIEVITNPSARYDAEGQTGIINIVLKKQDNSGLNGSFDVNTGWPHDHGGAFNLNYRKNWINFFISDGVNWDKSPGGGFSEQRYTFEDSTYAFKRDMDHLRGDLSNNLRLGADIYFNEKEVLTFAGTYQYSEGFRNNTTTYEDLNASDEVVETTVREQDETELEHEIELNGSYEKKFKKKDHKFTADVRYSLTDDTEDADYREYSNQPGSMELIQRSMNSEDEERLQVQSDYIHPFGNEGKFETGAKVSIRDIDNAYTVEELQDGQWIVLSQFDNNFVYEEDIYAAYAMIGEKFGKFSLQGGLRTEYSDISTRLLKTGEVNERDYINLFPSAFAGFEINKKNTIQASYSRRISRPRFWDLIPFRNYGDSRVIYAGNPNLNPEFTDSYELGFLRYFEKGSLLSSAYYRFTDGVINRITTVDSTGLTRIFPINMAVENNFGLELNGNYDIRDWWSVNANFNFYRSITDGEYEGEELFRDTYTWTARVSTKTTIAKLVDVQLSVRHRAPQETTQGRRKSITVMDFGASMDVLNKKGTLTFSVRDVFNSRIRRVEINQEDFTSYTEFQWRPRQFMLSFNYRLKQKKNRGPGRPEGGGGDDF